MKVGGGDSWMSPINKQFSNMGLLVRENIITYFIHIECFCGREMSGPSSFQMLGFTSQNV